MTKLFSRAKLILITGLVSCLISALLGFLGIFILRGIDGIVIGPLVAEIFCFVVIFVKVKDIMPAKIIYAILTCILTILPILFSSIIPFLLMPGDFQPF